MFIAIEKGPHGDTVYCENPKLQAYKQLAYIQNVLGRGYRLESHVDGQITVWGDGLAPLTYAVG